MKDGIMEKINYTKVIKITLVKISFTIMVLFIISNWVNIKQSFSSKIPEFSVWQNYSFTPQNIIVTCLLSVMYFFSTYKHHKKLAEKRAKYTAL